MFQYLLVGIILILLYMERKSTLAAMHRIESRLAIETVVEKARLRVRSNAVLASVKAKIGEEVSKQELVMFVEQEFKKIL